MTDKFGIPVPCTNCILRSEVCHVTCLRYKAFKHLHYHESEKLRKEKLGDDEVDERRRDSVVHWYKQDKWRKR